MRLRPWLTFIDRRLLTADGGFYPCPLTYPPGIPIWGPTTCNCLKVAGGATEDGIGDTLDPEHIGIGGLTHLINSEDLAEHPELAGLSVGDTINLADWTSYAPYITLLMLHVTPVGTGSLAGSGGYLGYNAGCNPTAYGGLWGLKGRCGPFHEAPPTLTTTVNGPGGPVSSGWITSPTDSTPAPTDWPSGTLVPSASAIDGNPYSLAVGDVSEIIVAIHGAYSQIAYGTEVIAYTAAPVDDDEGGSGHIHSAWV